ncbi:MAG TPA: hypothetical protein VER55_04930, partial [Ardenticatenaceae bacterium]|nr:hypothetical protein [Ardenticatenaceae bacterium]
MFADTLTARAFRAVLVVAMMMALAEAFLGAVKVLAPGYRPWWFLLATGLVTLEAFATARLSEHLRLRGRDRLVFHLVELGVLTIVLRLLTLGRMNFADARAIMIAWARYPSEIFDLEFLVLLALLILLWLSTVGIAEDLGLLELRRGDFDPEGRPYRGEYARGDRNSARGRLVRCFFWGGAALLLFVGIPRLLLVSRGEIAPFSRATPLAAVGYFIAGLALLSQAHLALLRLDWLSQEQRIDQRLETRWRVLSVLSIGAVAAAAVLIPTGYAGNLLEALAGALGVLGVIFSYVGLVLITLLTLPFALLLSLMRSGSPGERLPPIQPPPIGVPGTGGGPSWFEAFRLIAFWTILLIVIYHILAEYLRTHGIWLQELRRLPLLRHALDWLAALAAWARGRRAALGGALAGALRAVTPGRASRTAERRWPRLRLRGLPPREQIRYFYLSHVRRAAELGRPRRQDQTPSEYAADLTPEL